ncbi:MAG: transketolase [Bacillota bacterium]|jgi:transketolase
MSLSANEIDYLEHKAYNIRRHIIKTIINNGDGHAGPSLSCADILAVLFQKVLRLDPGNPKWPERDRFLLSAGHKCLALYGALVEAGCLKAEVLKQYNQLGTLVPGHPDMKKIGAIDFSTGSLGHGLPLGCGMALSAKLKGAGYKTYVLMGDGEQGEGSVWEAASVAAHHKLDNLVAILDRNSLQINGTTREVANTHPLEGRYRAFGWAVKVIDGHSMTEIYEALTAAPLEAGKPTMIVANTVKGKGLSFAEGNYKYHHWNPGREEAEQALNELVAAGKRWM